MSQSGPELPDSELTGSGWRSAIGLFCLVLMMSVVLTSGAGVRGALAQGLVESVNLPKVKTGKKAKPSGKVKKAKQTKKAKAQKAKLAKSKAKNIRRAKNRKIKTVSPKSQRRKNISAARRARALRRASAKNRLRAKKNARKKARLRQIERLKKSAQAGQKARVHNSSTSSAGNALSKAAYKAKLNQNTVTLMSGCCTTGAYTAFGADLKDMVARIDHKEGLRILPVLGGGAGTNIRDLLFLRGVDMAIINTDVIDYYKDRPLYENLRGRIRYITKLFNEEVHFYAGNSVSSLADLQGKIVGFNDSNAEVTGLILFEKLGIEPAQTIRISEADGALALKEGRLDAMIRVTGKPIRNVRRLKAIFPQIRLLPIHYDPAIIGSHLPTRLTHEDYPGLIAKGQVVPTVATRAILAVFNWKKGSRRYLRLEKFAKLLFENYASMRTSKNLHPKWAEVNLQASVPGLKRFAPAQKWLDDKARSAKLLASKAQKGNAQPEKPGAIAENRRAKNEKNTLMANFKKFMAGRKEQDTGTIKKSDSEKLITDFLRWKKQQR